MGSGCINRQKVKSQQKSTVNAVDQILRLAQGPEEAAPLRRKAAPWRRDLMKKSFLRVLNQKSLFFTQNHLFEPNNTYKQLPSMIMDKITYLNTQNHLS
jgi:hypothetical protein